MTDAGEGGSAPRSPGPGERAAGFVVAVLGIVLVAITPNPPETVQHWVQIVGGAALSASVVASAGWYEIRRLRLPAIPEWVKRRRVGVGVGVLLTAALAAGVPPGWDLVHGISVRYFGCAPATQLRTRRP